MLDFILDSKRKLVFVTSLLLAVSIFLTACFVDVNAGKRPYNYPNSVWICEEPYIHMTIHSDKTQTIYLGVGEDAQEFELCFEPGSGVDALKAGTSRISEETILFQGNCRFAEDHFTIYLTNDNLWDGQYSKLRFERVS